MRVTVSSHHTNPDWATALGKRLQALCELEVASGFPRGSKAESVTYSQAPGEYTRTGRKREEISVLKVAIYNEFGTSRIPARPFMAQALERAREDGRGTMGRLVKRVQDGSCSAEQAMMLVSLYSERAVKEAITDGDFAPNSPKTVKRKGSDHPLIDTGMMRATAVAVARPLSGEK